MKPKIHNCKKRIFFESVTWEEDDPQCFFTIDYYYNGRCFWTSEVMDEEMLDRFIETYDRLINLIKKHDVGYHRLFPFERGGHKIVYNAYDEKTMTIALGNIFLTIGNEYIDDMTKKKFLKILKRLMKELKKAKKAWFKNEN